MKNVPAEASADALKRVFGGGVDVKGVLTKFLAEQGVVVYAFYDIRHAQSAYRWADADGPRIWKQLAQGPGDGCITAQLVGPDDLEKVRRHPIAFTLSILY